MNESAIWRNFLSIMVEDFLPGIIITLVIVILIVGLALIMRNNKKRRENIMNLRERYTNKANSLLGRLEEEEVVELEDSEEEVRAAQDNPEPNGEDGAEEEIEPDRSVDYKYHQDYFQKVVDDFGIEDVDLAWSIWQKAIDTERQIH